MEGKTEIIAAWADAGLEPLDPEKLQVFFDADLPPKSPEAERLSHIAFCSSLEEPCIWGGDGQTPILALLSSSDGLEVGPQLVIRSALLNAGDQLTLTGLPAVQALARLWDLFPGAPCLRLEPPAQAFLKAKDLQGPLCLAWLRDVDRQADWSGIQVFWQNVTSEEDPGEP